MAALSMPYWLIINKNQNVILHEEACMNRGTKNAIINNCNMFTLGPYLSHPSVFYSPVAPPGQQFSVKIFTL